MNRKRILIINLFIVAISLVFTFYVMKMVYENSCMEIKEQYFKFTAGNLAEKIETSVNLGMDMNYSYGMSDILNEAVSYDEENMDAVLINTEGDVVEYTFKGEEKEAERLAPIYSPYLRESLDGEEKITDIGDIRALIEPIHVGDEYGYIIIMYDKDILFSINSLNIVNEYRENVNSISFLALESVKNSAYDLYKKGVKTEDIEKLADFYNRKFDDFGLVNSVEIGEGLYKDDDYVLTETVFRNSSEELDVALNIDRDYLRNIYIQAVLTFAASLIVCIMIVIEIGSLNKIAGGRLTKTEEEKNYKGTMTGIIKFFTFFAYLAVYAVLPYGAVIIRQEGYSLPGISVSFTSSLPVALNGVGILIMLIAGNKVLKKLKLNAYVAVTVLSAVIPLLMCFMRINLYFILVCSLLLGICLGMLKYAVNYFIAICSDTDSEITVNYGYYNGGMLAGLTLGGSIGGIISSARGYEYVYLAGGVIMLFVLPVLMGFIPYDYIKKRQNEYKSDDEEKSAAFYPFLKELVKRPRLLLDFIATSVSLNMGLMFIVSFLPVLLDMEGMSSLVNTYSYILYGIAGSYIGVYMVEKLKNISDNINGFIAMAVIALGVLVLIPKVCLVTILISAVLSGLFDGYGGALLSVIPVNSKNADGMDKSLLLTGSSVTGSIVCIISPVVYSFILNTGSITTNLVVIFLFFMLSGVYVLSIKQR